MTAGPLAAGLSVDLALVALKRGDLVDAAQNLNAALKADPRAVDAYYHLARVYGLADDDKTAAAIFRLAIAAAPEDFLSARTFIRLQGTAFDARTTRNFFDALAETTPFLRAYMAPSPWLGPGGPNLTPAQEVTIAERLDRAHADWIARRTPAPARASAFLQDALSPQTPWPRTLVFMPAHSASNPAFVIDTFSSHPRASLRDIGVPALYHAADDLCFDAANPDSQHDGRKPKAVALAEFEAAIASFRPDCVLMYGMFRENAATIGVDDLHRLKTRYGFRLIDFVADAYPPLPNYAAYWAGVADLTVTFSVDRDDSYCAALAGPTLAAPCQALADSIVGDAANRQKTIDLLYAGARTRNRDFWCAHAVMAGLNATIVVGNRRQEMAQTEAAFYDTLGRAKLALSSGSVTPDLDIVVFRPFEAAAAGAVSLHNGPALEQCFVPYVHYVPFDTVHELILLSRFLLADDGRRQRIRDEAQRFWHAHYRAELFWRAVFGRLAA